MALHLTEIVWILELNGGTLLCNAYKTRLEDGLVVTDTEPRADVIDSTLKMEPPERQSLIAVIEQEMIRQAGVIHVAKETGLLEMEQA